MFRCTLFGGKYHIIMKNFQKEKIEIAKNILLVVLFLLTILLLSFLWAEKGLEDFILTESRETKEVLLAEEVFLPDKIIISKGKGDFEIPKKTRELWVNEILPILKNIDSLGNKETEEITGESYNQVLEFPFIAFTFKDSIALKDFKNIFGIKNKMNLEEDIWIKHALFSKADEKCIFIYDDKENRYFRIIAEKNILKLFYEDGERQNNDKDRFDLSEIMKKYGGKEKITYYRLKEFFGEKSKKNTLVMLEQPKETLNIKFEKNLEIKTNEEKDRIAEKFFGKTLDFVRKIEESEGKTIYMYGFGQKVLIIDDLGYVEYKEVVKPDNSKEHTFTENLQVALEFMSDKIVYDEDKNNFGDLVDEKPRIMEIIIDKTKKDSVVFKMCIAIEDKKVYSPDYEQFEIGITSGKVDYYHQDFYEISQNKKSLKKQIGLTPIELISKNYVFIQKAEAFAKESSIPSIEILKKGKIQEKSVEDIAGKIENIEIGYYKNDEKGELQCVWILETEDMRFEFELDSGEPIHCEKR